MFIEIQNLYIMLLTCVDPDETAQFCRFKPLVFAVAKRSFYIGKAPILLCCSVGFIILYDLSGMCWFLFQSDILFSLISVIC